MLTNITLLIEPRRAARYTAGGDTLTETEAVLMQLGYAGGADDVADANSNFLSSALDFSTAAPHSAAINSSPPASRGVQQQQQQRSPALPSVTQHAHGASAQRFPGAASSPPARALDGGSRPASLGGRRSGASSTDSPSSMAVGRLLEGSQPHAPTRCRAATCTHGHNGFLVSA
jgi:hypothetical protein